MEAQKLNMANAAAKQKQAATLTMVAQATREGLTDVQAESVAQNGAGDAETIIEEDSVAGE